MASSYLVYREYMKSFHFQHRAFISGPSLKPILVRKNMDEIQPNVLEVIIHPSVVNERFLETTFSEE